ncbi:alpha/beta hydrolase [Gardnerella vaginalis]|uniref:PGAP1-like alpha/beta domain-containing protein n=1 Tax=Gardnerella vaginalis TaxID=2702 RepID=UPI0039EE96F2
MSWKVKSSVVGGIKLSVSDREAYISFSRKLNDTAKELLTLKNLWLNAAMVIASQNNSLQKESEAYINDYSQSFLTESMCNEYANKCCLMSQNLENLAFLIARANNLYEDAEFRAKNDLDNKISYSVLACPILALPVLLSAGLAVNQDNKNHSGFQNLARWSYATNSLQQGIIRGLSQHLILNPITGSPIFIAGNAKDRMSKGERETSLNFLYNAKKYLLEAVPFISSAISFVSAPINNIKQGNNLLLTKVNETWRKPGFVLARPGRNLLETLENLTELGSGNLGVRPPLVNPDAATIAIQQFKRNDGSSSWLVIIPGTDGKAHSPFGWEQNAEVMSHSSLVRKQADSTRMVVEAMKRSGIKPNEPVALVGHSQGGIVAASIASDYSKQYNIQHVVTAGSPIANHPIPKKTWVTSIEMDDEIVPSLDGKENPRRNNWVTIHGHAIHVKESKRSLPPGVTRFSGKQYSTKKFDNGGIFVNDVPEEGTLTHDLHYHTAAYEDALQLGSKSVREQDRHFQNIINGKLQSTTLWQGVMKK